MTVNPASEPRYKLSDAHFHLLNFIQADDGPERLIEVMDEAGVENIMVNGMGLCKKWSEWDPVEPSYYLDDDSRVYPYSVTDVLVHERLTSVDEEQQKRFHPFICGFDATDRNAVDHIKRMIQLYPGFWQGIGEVFARHDDLTALKYGEPGRADHIALHPVYDFAAEHGMPVSVHHDITSVWHHEGVIYLGELRRALEPHPHTTFIWCHAGVSRRLTVSRLPDVVRELLGEFPQLHLDLSWVVYDIQLVRHGRPNEEWLRLIEDFPDRFMIGSDTVSDTSQYVPTMTRYYLILDSLRPETAKKVGRDNFLRLLPSSRVKLDVV
ncbi:amidohydrolase family protein [Nocardia arthritidis]|uniref:Amidohydrolase family protein n=1 Tax=Nocardia arthritidis TaxID=228602 RepID=A0A6G9YLK7_9NOCA|nr:amidohydrolase family protein [Nocardia arthritidis]QIS14088.1 amidohydrolase family protein [Nocardia arthritidis]